MRIVAIGDTDTAFGFELVGCEGRAVESADDAATALHQAVADEDVAIVCITRDWAAQLGARLAALRLHRDRPIILEIPDRWGTPPERSLEEVVRRAVGLHL
jgi:V/A-type H+-transporting ATPase subunit F